MIFSRWSTSVYLSMVSQQVQNSIKNHKCFVLPPKIVSVKHDESKIISKSFTQSMYDIAEIVVSICVHVLDYKDNECQEETIVFNSFEVEEIIEKPDRTIYHLLTTIYP